jgi:hypothetical protein
MEQAMCKLALLVGMFRGPGEVVMDSTEREGLYLILCEICDSLAAMPRKSCEKGGRGA